MSEPTTWATIDDLIEEFQLDADSSDLVAVREALLDRMKVVQHTDEFARWVAALKFVDGGSRRLFPAVRYLPVLRRDDAVTRHEALEGRAETSRTRSIEAIKVRSRRWTIGYGALSAVIALLWTFPNTTNPLLRVLSPYEWRVRDSATEDEGLEFNSLRTCLWVIALAVLLILWFAAYRRHHRELAIVSDAHDPSYQAGVLRGLASAGLLKFTQDDYEQQMLNRHPRDYLSREEFEEKIRVPVFMRVFVSLVAPLIQISLLLFLIFSMADSVAYYEDGDFSVPAVIAVVTIELALSLVIVLAWADPANRESLAALLRFFPTEEAVARPVRDAADIALQRFVQRGTLVPADDIGFLATYAFTRLESSAGGSPTAVADNHNFSEP